MASEKDLSFLDEAESPDLVGAVILKKIEADDTRFKKQFERYKNHMLAAFRRGHTKKAIREAMVALDLLPKISYAQFNAVWKDVMPKDTTIARKRSAGVASNTCGTEA